MRNWRVCLNVPQGLALPVPTGVLLRGLQNAERHSQCGLESACTPFYSYVCTRLLLKIRGCGYVRSHPGGPVPLRLFWVFKPRAIPTTRNSLAGAGPSCLIPSSSPGLGPLCPPFWEHRVSAVSVTSGGPPALCAGTRVWYPHHGTLGEDMASFPAMLTLSEVLASQAPDTPEAAGFPGTDLALGPRTILGDTVLEALLWGSADHLLSLLLSSCPSCQLVLALPLSQNTLGAGDVGMHARVRMCVPVWVPQGLHLRLMASPRAE